MKATDEITNSQDIIDIREVEDRIHSLEGTEDEDEKIELANLKQLKEDASTSEWEYGVQLIRDGYFEDYARELAEDIGAISEDTQWPCNCIDWERACNELKIDYTSVDFDGVEYYFR